MKMKTVSKRQRQTSVRGIPDDGSTFLSILNKDIQVKKISYLQQIFIIF